MSVDPAFKLFASLSVYNYAGNNPIYNIDFAGQYIKPYDEKSREELELHFQRVFNSQKTCAMANLLSSHLGIEREKISRSEFRKALKGLSPEQKQLARGYYKTINSERVVVFASLDKDRNVPEEILRNINSEEANWIRNQGLLKNILNNNGSITTNDRVPFVITSYNYDFNQSFETTGKEQPGEGTLNYSKDEVIAHEAVGHGFGSFIKQQGDAALFSVQISNLVRKIEAKKEMRNGNDHHLDASKNPNVTETPKELKSNR